MDTETVYGVPLNPILYTRPALTLDRLAQRQIAARLMRRPHGRDGTMKLLALIRWLSRLRQPGKQPPVKSRPAKISRKVEYQREEDDGEWLDWRARDKDRDPAWAIYEVVHVKGTGPRMGKARSFIDAAKSGEKMGLTLEREPTNAHDANAIRVLVEGDQLGYVPADVAAKIAKNFPPDMPLRACLDRISTLEDKFAIFIEVIRPSKRSDWWKQNMK